MSKLLINEPPLVLQKTLAVKLGLNEAIMLQQIHYWASMKKNIKDGYYWVYNSYEDWNEQFPFFSKSTIGRVLRNLEKSGVIIVGNYNKLSFDKTKWYRIDYKAVKALEDEGSDDGFISPLPIESEWYDDDTKLTPPMTSKLTNNTIDYTKTTTEKKTIVEPKASTPVINKNDEIIKKVIQHLNDKTGKRFRASTNAHYKSINARLNDGYTLDDILYVIDNKCLQWLNTRFEDYLTPTTLFRPSNFVNYLNESPYKPKGNHIQDAAVLMQMASEAEKEEKENGEKRRIESNGDDTHLLPF